jgi:hypothetical protein
VSVSAKAELVVSKVTTTIANRAIISIPSPYRRRGSHNRALTIRIWRDLAGSWSTNSERAYPTLTASRPRT